MTTQQEEGVGREEGDTKLPYCPPLHGNVLDAVLSHVPVISLFPASRVSPSWRLAAASSLRRHPLLILHLQNPRRTSLAYDPIFRSWAPLPPSHVPLTLPPVRFRSSLPSLFHCLTTACLSLSRRPLAATWLHLRPPRVFRTDPVVALVGPSTVIVAGGAADFEDSCRPVEVLDLRDPSAGWTLSDQMPKELGQSPSATWLSVAASDDRLFVLDKDSGVFSSFDPVAGRWSRACELKPDPRIRLSAIGFSSGRLLLVGLSSEDPDPISLRVWEVSLCSGSEAVGFAEIGRMPGEMAVALTSSGFGLTTIGFGLEGDFGYFYNPQDFSEGAVSWDIGERRWERVARPEALDEDPTARIVFGCARFGLQDLKIDSGVF